MKDSKISSHSHPPNSTQPAKAALIVDFSLPAAQGLADLSSLLADLKSVNTICDELIRMEIVHPAVAMEKIQKSGEDESIAVPKYWASLPIASALWEAAIVKIGRTKNSGARPGLKKEWLEKLSPDLMESLDSASTLRDKFIAHCVSELDEDIVRVSIELTNGKPTGVLNVQANHTTVHYGILHQANDLKALAIALIKIIENEIASEKKQVAEAAITYGLEKLVKRGYINPPLPVLDRKKGRKKYQGD